MHGNEDVINIECEFEAVLVDDLPPQIREFAKKVAVKNSVLLCAKDYTFFLLKPKGVLNKKFSYVPFVRQYRIVSKKIMDGYTAAIVEQVIYKRGSARWDTMIVEYTEKGTMKLHTLTDAIDKGIVKLLRITDTEIVVEINGKEERFNKAREYLSLYTSRIQSISSFNNLPDEYREDYLRFIGEIEDMFSNLSKQVHEKVEKIQAKYNIEDDYKLRQAVAKVLLKI